ncbi:MAG: hypothetical protein KDI44_09110 [Thiothrix sp.]|nr:hypothetical protein [Thiothrix sp.]
MHYRGFINGTMTTATPEHSPSANKNEAGLMVALLQDTCQHYTAETDDWQIATPNPAVGEENNDTRWSGRRWNAGSAAQPALKKPATMAESGCSDSIHHGGMFFMKTASVHAPCAQARSVVPLMT